MQHRDRHFSPDPAPRNDDPPQALGARIRIPPVDTAPERLNLLVVLSSDPSPIRGSIPLFRRRLTAWFDHHGRDLPWRRTRDPYAILVSETMLQQTQVATVLPYYERWMRRFPNLTSLASSPEEEVLRHWEGLGYYRRAQNLLRTARAITEEHGGRFPATVDALRRLPGIGPYTAGAVVAFAYDRPVPLVDGNIARVLARLADLRLPTDTAAGRNALWMAANNLQPHGPRGGRRFNSALMELGARICKPSQPICGDCPVRTHCQATRPELLPIQRSRPRLRDRIEDRAWIRNPDGSLVVGQEPGGRWNGLWVLPLLRVPPRSGHPLCILSHSVMNERITLRVWRDAPRPPGPNERRLPPDDPQAVPMPAPHRRVVRRLWSG